MMSRALFVFVALAGIDAGMGADTGRHTESG